MTYHFSVFFPNWNDVKNSFQTLGGKIWPLVLNSPMTFVPGLVVLCLFPISIEIICKRQTTHNKLFRTSCVFRKGIQLLICNLWPQRWVVSFFYYFPIFFNRGFLFFADWMSTAKITCPLKYPALQYVKRQVQNSQCSHKGVAVLTSNHSKWTKLDLLLAHLCQDIFLWAVSVLQFKLHVPERTYPIIMFDCLP